MMQHWSSADVCTAGPLQTDVLHGPLLISVMLVLYWLLHRTASPLLTDVLHVLCWQMYIQYCWSSAACCPSSLPLTDTMCVILLKWPGIFTEFSVKNSKYTERFTKYSVNIFSWNTRKYQQKVINCFFSVNKCTF